MNTKRFLYYAVTLLLSTGALAQNNDVDIEKTVKTTHLLAEQGEADAQYNLGNCYAFGDGVEQSYTEAVKWYKKAAEQGHEDAKKELDFMGF